MGAESYEINRLLGEIDRVIWLFRGIVKRHVMLKLAGQVDEHMGDISFFAHEVADHLYPSRAFHGFFPHETATLFRSLEQCELITIVDNPFEDPSNNQMIRRMKLIDSRLPKGHLGDVIRLTKNGLLFARLPDDRVHEYIQEHDDLWNQRVRNEAEWRRNPNK